MGTKNAGLRTSHQESDGGEKLFSCLNWARETHGNREHWIEYVSPGKRWWGTNVTMVVVLSGDVVVILQNLRIPLSFFPCFPTLLQACGPYLESSSLNVSSISSHANIEQCVRSNRQKKADVDRPVGQRAAYDSYSKNVDTNWTRNFEKTCGHPSKL
jgi:hypothetical protein